MECFVCGKQITNRHLCKRHLDILVKMLEKEEGVTLYPSWRHRCLICGEYKDRIIVEYPSIGYFCNRDIMEELDKYNQQRIKKSVDKTKECFVCGKLIEKGNLCKEHLEILVEMLKKGEGILLYPEWKHHCLICGEYKDRIMVEYPSIGYFCDRDIMLEADKYDKVDDE